MKKSRTAKSDVNKQRVSSIDLLKGRILYDNILLRPVVLGNEGVVLRPQQYEDKPEWGEVIAVGNGRIFDNGEVVPLMVKPGDLVLFQKYSAQKFRHEGKDYLIIREEDVHFING